MLFGLLGELSLDRLVRPKSSILNSFSLPAFLSFFRLPCARPTVLLFPISLSVALHSSPDALLLGSVSESRGTEPTEAALGPELCIFRLVVATGSALALVVAFSWAFSLPVLLLFPVTSPAFLSFCHFKERVSKVKLGPF